MPQDAHYLADDGRVLAAAASQSTAPDEQMLWANSSAATVLVERQLHAAHVADLRASSRSPICTADTS
jgi:thiaminase/transcriptional activator TenA